MKMNAKKIQLKIFAVLLVAIMLCCGFFLAGCKDGNEKDDEDTNPGTQSSTTISLSEAKTIIVNALALDEDSSSAEQQGNRDLFEKFGMVQLNLQSGAQDYTTGEMDSQDELVAYYEYSNNSIQKYNASGSSISAEYGETAYQEYSPDYITMYRDTNGTITEMPVSTDESLEGEYADSEDMAVEDLINQMFRDEAFEKVYEENVVKNSVDNGFTLTLSSDYKGFIRLSSLDLPDDEFDMIWGLMSIFIVGIPQELKDAEKFEISINFDENEQITSLEFSLVYGIMDEFSSESEVASYSKNSMNITISKYAGEITEPQWVTDYLANKESSN